MKGILDNFTKKKTEFCQSPPGRLAFGGLEL